MGANMIGGIIGLIVGLMGFLVLRLVASRIESQGVGPDPHKTAAVLRWVAAIDMVFFTVVGYFIGPTIVTGAGN